MTHRGHVVRVALSIAAVAVVTGAIFGLKAIAPVLSLGIVYLLAVLPVAVFFGLGYALAVSIGSMLAFNFFFLPPLHTLALTDSENWVALAVFVVTAAVVSELATRARRRALAAAEADTLRRSDVVKTAVLHAVSHDLRSPLTAIRAASEGLESASLELGDADRAELLETIRLETARLERLVANLLDLSRLEAGAARPQRELWPIDELVSRALDGLGAEAARVTVALADEAPLVSVDAAQLERVLANVLENALRFSSPSDRVELVGASTGDDVLIRISDRGPGLDEDDLERIFEPFEHGRGGGRGNGTRPRNCPRLRGGQRLPALGRAVVAGQARRSSSHSRPLPPGRRCSDEQAARARGGRRAADPARAADEPPRGRVRGRHRLDRRGCARRCRDASAGRCHSRPGASGPSGTEVCRELRTWSSAPVLVLSVVGDEPEKVAALDAGADDYIEKPFGIEELLARLRAVLRRAGPSGGPVLEIGELVVDLDKRSLAVGGRPVSLTPHEFELLRVLAQNEGKLMTHPAILREVWGPAYGEESHYLHVYISQLRRKIEDDPARPRYLLTEAGAGYRLVTP